MSYGALDMVDIALKTATTPYLGVVDRAIGPDGVTEWTVSAFVTPSGMRLMLLAEGRPDEAACKTFFTECHQSLLRVLYKVPNYILDYNESIPSQPRHSNPLQTVYRKDSGFA